MSNQYPLVSIGIPSYNCSNYIIQTIESVRCQNYPNIELIIVDDCSTDDSFEIISKLISSKKNFDIRLIRNSSNLGVVKTCNILLDNFKGKYFSILGADDIIIKDKITRQVEIFESSLVPLSFVYSDAEVIDEEGNIIQKSFFKRIGYNEDPSKNIFMALLKLNFIPALTALVRTSIVKENGGYDERLNFEDWDMWLRLSQRYNTKYIPQITGYYRVRGGSIMHSTSHAQKINSSTLLMFKKFIGTDINVNKVVFERIKERAIYSYYKGDQESTKNLLWYLKRKFDFKVLCYYFLSGLGLRLPFRS